jgi:hypothetical protein
MADCRDNPRYRGADSDEPLFSWLAHFPNAVNTGKRPTVPEHFWNDAKSPTRVSRHPGYANTVCPEGTKREPARHAPDASFVKLAGLSKIRSRLRQNGGSSRCDRAGSRASFSGFVMT